MNTEIRQNFTSALRSLLSANNETQLELSKAIGVSPASVNDWVSGKKMPRADKLSKIAEHFGVELSFLIGASNPSNITISQLPADVQQIVALCQTNPELATALLNLARQLSKL